MRNPRKHGFTLVELLVVIAIIALLMAVLLPSLNKARESARSIKCLVNQRSIVAGLAMYEMDHDGYIVALAGMEDANGNYVTPYQAGYNTCNADYAVHDYSHHASGLGVYVPNPWPGGTARDGYTGYTNIKMNTAWSCPSTTLGAFPDGNGRLISYGIHDNVYPKRNQYQNAAQAKSVYRDRFFKSSRIVGPASMMYTIDCGWSNFVPGTDWEPWTEAYTASLGSLQTNRAVMRHVGTAVNLSYMDGHVGSTSNLANDYFVGLIRIKPDGSQ